MIVAILVSLTAITRLVEEQRGLIGTYKSLGFAKHQVYAKYLIYALSACIIGGIIGNVFGFVLLPLFLFTVFDVMYVLPGYPIVYNVASGVLGILLFVVAIGGSAFLSCRSEIHQTPADLLRPKVPKFGSRIFLERIRFVWKRLSFLNKVTARNLFRYKKRFFMTVAGIMGCTALIVCAFVIKDSVALMAPEQYESIDRYDIMAVVDADDLEQVAEDLSADGKVASLTRALVDSGEVATARARWTPRSSSFPTVGRLKAISRWRTLPDPRSSFPTRGCSSPATPLRCSASSREDPRFCRTARSSSATRWSPACRNRIWATTRIYRRKRTRICSARAPTSPTRCWSSLPTAWTAPPSPTSCRRIRRICPS